MNEESKIPKMATKSANPDSPAVFKIRPKNSKENWERTRSYFPLGLESCYTGVAAQSQEVEEYLPYV